MGTHADYPGYLKREFAEAEPKLGYMSAITAKLRDIFKRRAGVPLELEDSLGDQVQLPKELLDAVVGSKPPGKGGQR